MIHPTAIIDSRARLDPTVSVGPYAVIDGQVMVGANCRIGPHVHLTGQTGIGANNIFHTGCVIGDAPQDLKYKGESTRLRIGEHNVFREQVTVHRSNTESDETVIGSHNFLMAHCHVGHNSRIGDRVIIVNGALIGGHVVIGDRAYISGNCLLHQFVRMGALALTQGGSVITQDLPPYCVARGVNGLRRAGLTAEQRLELKRLYRALFRRREKLSVALAAARRQFPGEVARVLIEFVATSKRGLCADMGTRTGKDTDGDESSAH